ncbi:MAG TPA: CopD family protein, partial [Dehalococcoidia bacterium]|nr:CopD family protein [Dehalococcoidia bacterium]
TAGQAAPAAPQGPPPGEAAAEGPASFSPYEVLVRWASLAGSSVLFGGFVLALLYRRTARSPEDLLGLFGKHLRSSMVLALGLLACAVPLFLALQAVSIGDLSPPALVGLLVETRFGHVWLARGLLLIALGAVLFLWKGQSWDRNTWAGLGLAALLLLTFSLSSHGAAQAGGWALPVLSDWVHFLAAAAWIGGLVHLGRLLLRSRDYVYGRGGPVGRPQARSKPHSKGKGKGDSKARRRTGERETSLLVALLLPFSTLAIVAVSILLLTGLYNSWLELNTLESLWTTAYGTTLLVKLGLSIPALLLGGVNFWRLSRISSPASQQAAMPRQGAILLEAVVGMALLLAVAVLVALPPARQGLAQTRSAGIAMTQRAGDVAISLEVDPGSVGRNRFRSSIRDAPGRPLEEPGRLIMRFEYLDGELEGQGAFAQRVGPGLFEGEWGYLEAAGRWDIQVIFRQEGREDLAASFPVMVEIPDAVLADTGGSTAGLGSAASLIELEVLVLGLIVAGAGWLKRDALGAVLERPFRGFLRGLGYDPGRPMQVEAVTALVGTGALVAFIGMYLLAGELLTSAASGLPRNPIPPGAVSRAVGRVIYEEKCLSCHGSEGAGDGPAVQKSQEGLDLRPHVLAHPSGQIWVWITYGLGTDMPAFEDELGDEERWHLVNYVRTFGQSSTFGVHAH